MWVVDMASTTTHLDAPVEVKMPIRDIVVRVRPGDTHHCQGLDRESRLIYLFQHDGSLQSYLITHNGVDCRAGECTWWECVEYTLGDHFLV